MAAVEFLDGPLKGRIHEIRGGWSVPVGIAIPKGNKLYHYKVNKDRKTAHFEKTEVKGVI